MAIVLLLRERDDKPVDLDRERDKQNYASQAAARADRRDFGASTNFPDDVRQDAVIGLPLPKEERR